MDDRIRHENPRNSRETLMKQEQCRRGCETAVCVIVHVFILLSRNREGSLIPRGCAVNEEIAPRDGATSKEGGGQTKRLCAKGEERDLTEEGQTRGVPLHMGGQAKKLMVWGLPSYRAIHAQLNIAITIDRSMPSAL